MTRSTPHRTLKRHAARAAAGVAALAICWAVPVARAQPRTAADTPEFIIDRSGRPATADAAESRATLDAFAQAYTQAGKPRVALYWNRVLSDQLSNSSREIVQLQANQQAGYVSARVSTGTEVEVEAVRRTDLTERDLWQVETEFTRRMLDAGVQVVDRAAIMRLTAGQQASAAQAQSVEVAALAGKADLWLEVLLARDAAAPLGWGFRGNLKEVKSGRTLSTLYLTAMPLLSPAGRATYRARPGGYDLVPGAPASITVQSIGNRLALDLMEEMTRRLARQ